MTATFKPAYGKQTLVTPVQSLIIAPAAAVPRPEGPQGPPAAVGAVPPARHWPLKLRLAPLDDALLQNAALFICGDCTAFATRSFHDLLTPNQIMLIGCPKFEEPRMLAAKLEELFSQVRPSACTVARMEKPCCKGLHTLCRDAAQKTGALFTVREIVVSCAGGVETCAVDQPFETL